MKAATDKAGEATLLHIPGYKVARDRQSILRLAGDGNYTQLYLTDRIAPLLISQTLKYFEPILPQFIRINKSALINPNYVREVIDKGCKQLQVVLIDGTVMDVSRRRINETKERLFDYQYDEQKRIWIVLQQPTLLPLWPFRHRNNRQKQEATGDSLRE